MRIRHKLGEPAFEAPGVLLYQVDSLVAMPLLTDEIVDLTITSPPYNIGKEYETPMPLESYIQWTDMWIREVYRLTKPSGAFWLNLGYLEVPPRGRAIPLPYLVWERIPFYLIQEVVWNYGAGVAARRMFSPRNEKFLWYAKSPDQYTFNLDAVRDPNVKYPNQKKNGKLRVNQNGKNPTDVWQIPKVTTGEGMTGRRASPERTSHPAQFPFAVIDRIVKACSNPGDLVFDPFIGSGTTAEVAVANGRLVVGFEIRGEYAQIAIKRLKRYLYVSEHERAQGRLFDQIHSYSTSIL
jgi:adenine-specific DNA-methyltransferase